MVASGRLEELALDVSLVRAIAFGDEPVPLSASVARRPLLKTALRAIQLWMLLVRVFARRPHELRFVLPWLWSLRNRDAVATHTPVLPYSALDFLDGVIDRSSNVFEFGAGGSTLWFAEHAADVTSVEDDPHWYAVVDAERRRSSLSNCRIVLRSASPADRDDAAIEALGIARADVILVDSSAEARMDDLDLSKRSIRPGGYLALDDSQRAEYRSPIADLAGWPRRDFWGLRPRFIWPSRTTVWQRPASRPEERTG